MLSKSLAVATLLASAVLFGCQPKPKPPLQAIVSEGSTIKLILLQQLESGVTQEGEEVRMLVVEDLKDLYGNVAVPRGQTVTGKVTWSRREDGFDAMSNRPARLAVKFDTVKAVDGQPVKLTADIAGKPDEPYQLNRDNTGRVALGEKMDAYLRTQEGQMDLARLNDMFQQGSTNYLDGQMADELLTRVAKQLDLEETNKAMSSNQGESVRGLVKQIREGNAVAALASGGAGLAVPAALELAAVAGEASDKLSRMLSGRNIKAYIGTPMEAYVAEKVTVTLPQK